MSRPAENSMIETLKLKTMAAPDGEHPASVCTVLYSVHEHKNPFLRIE